MGMAIEKEQKQVILRDFFIWMYWLTKSGHKQGVCSDRMTQHAELYIKHNDPT